MARVSNDLSNSRPSARLGCVDIFELSSRIAILIVQKAFMQVVAEQCKVQKHHPEWSNVRESKFRTEQVLQLIIINCVASAIIPRLSYGRPTGLRV